MHSRFVLLVDNDNAIKHVFLKHDPTEADGWDLWPAILLARRLVSLLGDLKIVVSAEKALSRKNPAHHIAKSEMQYRRGRGWRPNEDYWPEPLPRAFQEVWVHVARNRSCSGMCLPVDLLRIYCFSDDVLNALVRLAGA